MTTINRVPMMLELISDFTSLGRYVCISIIGSRIYELLRLRTNINNLPVPYRTL